MKNIKKTGKNAFIGADNLKTITVSGDNNEDFMVDENGVLYDKEKKTMILFPNANNIEEYTIPASVTRIDCSFGNNLKKISFEGLNNPKCSNHLFRNSNIGYLYIQNEYTTNNFCNFPVARWNNDKTEAIVEGSCGSNCNLQFDVVSGQLTISGNGQMLNYKEKEQPWYPYRNEIKEIIIEEGITSIGEYAFNDIKNLKKLVLAKGITKIGTKGISKCPQLESITYPVSVTSFPDDLFEECQSVREVQWIGTGKMPNFTETSYPMNNIKTTLEEVVIEEGITAIGSYAFSSCKILENVQIGNTITSISNYAFYGCKSLPSITIPDSVILLGSYAFEYCSSLESTIIGDGVTSIGADAFAYCPKLTTVKIGKKK